ncbi:MAG TPA: hypothetical protein VIF34_05080 [Methylocystis sp.]|jgi:hypothetical protein
MRHKVDWRALGVAAFGMIAALPATNAFADSTSEEIRLLKARLKQLEAKVGQQERAAKAEKSHPGHVAQAAVVTPGFGPDHIYFKGLEITPAGFFAAESVYRDHWMGADINTPFQNIPYPFQPGYHTTEWRASARPSRPAMMIKADLDKQTHIMAYGEVDFLGAAQTANSNGSNSYNLRLRQAYGNVDLDEWGLHVAAGQMWSLVTLNSVGIRPDTSLQPPVIDHQYMPGYNWARQAGFRITKDFNKQIWASLAVESGATTFAAPGPTLAAPFVLPGVTTATAIPLFGSPVLLAPAVGGGLFNPSNNYSFNRIPDVIGKVAWDGELAERKIHVEGFGILRDATGRSYWGTHSQWGGGGGGGVVVQLWPKLLDFQFSGMIGKGIGRYGSAGLPDATFQLSGAPQWISERIAMAGLTLHATPQTDVYAFVGGEFAGKQPQWGFQAPATLLVGGYGNWFYNNSGCGLENDAVAAAMVAANTSIFPCSSQNKALRQITGGLWHTLYHGPAGKIRTGLQYSYTVRSGFPGFGWTPHAAENMVFTSIRYYPFDGTAPTPVLAKY